MQAAKWYRKAADQGMSEAQFSLARLYEEGLGVKRDPVEAYFWFSLAAESDATASTARDHLAAELSSRQIEGARRRVKDWTPQPTNDLEFLLWLGGAPK